MHGFLCRSACLCTRQTCKLNNNKAKHRQKHQFTHCSPLERRGEANLVDERKVFNLKPLEREGWESRIHDPKSLRKMLINIDWFLIVFESFRLVDQLKIECSKEGKGIICWEMSHEDVQQMINAPVDWLDPWLTDKDIAWFIQKREKILPKNSSGWVENRTWRRENSNRTTEKEFKAEN